MFGVDSLKSDLVSSGRTLNAMRDRFEDGTFQPLPIEGLYALSEGSAAFERVAAGSKGRLVLRPNAGRSGT